MVTIKIAIIPAKKNPKLKKKSPNVLSGGIPKSARFRFNPNLFLDIGVNYITKYSAS